MRLRFGDLRGDYLDAPLTHVAAGARHGAPVLMNVHHSRLGVFLNRGFVLGVVLGVEVPRAVAAQPFPALGKINLPTLRVPMPFLGKCDFQALA